MRLPDLRLGLQIPVFNFPDTPPEQLLDRLTAIATTAEDNGFDSVWVMDHLHQIPPVGPPELWMLEATSALAALAARTRKASLGMMVGGVTYRNPAHLAKSTTTLDVLSGGRAILGIGAAWFEDEHVAYGFDFPPLRERFERLEDALRIARAMFTQEQPTVEGTHHSVRAVLNNPRPIRGDIPILIGGSGEKKTLRMVAQYADASNVGGDVERVRHLMGVLDRHCEDVGRDPAEITRTKIGVVLAGATHEQAEAKFQAIFRGRDEARAMVMIGDADGLGEQVQQYLDAGLDGLIVSVPDAADLEALTLVGKTLRAAVGG